MIVRFLVKSTGVSVEKFIPSYYKAMKFINKLRHSKDCVLLSYVKL